MEIKIGELFREALENPSKESIIMMSEGLEKFVLMVINALGILEEKIISLENDIKSLKQIVESKLKEEKVKTPSIEPVKPPTPKLPPAVPPVAVKPSKKREEPLQKPKIETSVPRTVKPGEEEIEAFRKRLLKPAPKREEKQKKPVSLRDALMQELKSYFSTAMKKMHKDETES
ncbi:MAG: hypothetical protein J7J30_00010 [Candidatus Odinarchaeota archaeon]|nr:hypothetical protein [Candidatus Odinarchaeota archaeon]